MGFVLLSKSRERANAKLIDNGKGISPELLEKIFDPYFSTKESVTQKGLGMGLAICYSIMPFSHCFPFP